MHHPNPEKRGTGLLLSNRSQHGHSVVVRNVIRTAYTPAGYALLEALGKGAPIVSKVGAPTKYMQSASPRNH